MMNKLVVTLLFLLATALTPVIVNAQETATPAAVVQQITSEPQSLSAEIRRLKTQYRGELEEYRRLESQYTIAKQQYKNLKTLTSLEDGVRATQAAMEARARVLRTYLQILKVSLLQQTGIDIEEKDSLKNELDQVIGQVDQHHKVFEAELDKEGVQEVANEFVALSGAAEEVSYHTLSVLALGELQSVYDNVQSLADEIQSVVATQGGALKQGQRQRGFDETKRNLDEVNAQLKLTRNVLLNEKNSGKSSYDSLRDDLASVYGQLSRTISFLQELVGL